jgi:hypothetical protein
LKTQQSSQLWTIGFLFLRCIYYLTETNKTVSALVTFFQCYACRTSEPESSKPELKLVRRRFDILYNSSSSTNDAALCCSGSATQSTFFVCFFSLVYCLNSFLLNVFSFIRFLLWTCTDSYGAQFSVRCYDSQYYIE